MEIICVTSFDKSSYWRN